MQIITFPNAPEWVQETQLDGRSYRLRARWNTTSNRWSLDMLTRDRTLIVAGLRLVRGAGLLFQFQDTRLPAGDLVVYDIGTPVDDYTDFPQGRAVLAYLSAAEIEALRSDQL